MIIKIKDIEYKLKYTLRALIIFEKISKKTFQLESLTDQLVFLYSILLANNQEMTLTFDEMIEAIDQEPSILEKFSTYLLSDMNKNALLNPVESIDKKKE